MFLNSAYLLYNNLNPFLRTFLDGDLAILLQLLSVNSIILPFSSFILPNFKSLSVRASYVSAFLPNTSDKVLNIFSSLSVNVCSL